MKDPEYPLKTSSTTHDNATLLHEPSRLSRFLARIWLPGMMPQYRSCLPGSLEKCISHVTHVMQIFHHFAENWIGQKKHVLLQFLWILALQSIMILRLEGISVCLYFILQNYAKLGWMAWRNALPLTRLNAASPSTPASPRIFKSPWTSSTTWSVPLPSESMISNLAFFGQDFQPFRSNSEKDFGNSTVAEKWQVGSVPWEFQVIHQSLSKSSMLPIMSYPILGESWNSIQKQCWTWKLVTHRKWDNLKKYLDTSVLDDQQK